MYLPLHDSTRAGCAKPLSQLQVVIRLVEIVLRKIHCLLRLKNRRLSSGAHLDRRGFVNVGYLRAEPSR